MFMMIYLHKYAPRLQSRWCFEIFFSAHSELENISMLLISFPWIESLKPPRQYIIVCDLHYPQT